MGKIFKSLINFGERRSNSQWLKSYKKDGEDDYGTYGKGGKTLSKQQIDWPYNDFSSKNITDEEVSKI